MDGGALITFNADEHISEEEDDGGGDEQEQQQYAGRGYGGRDGAGDIGAADVHVDNNNLSLNQTHNAAAAAGAAPVNRQTSSIGTYIATACLCVM